ncbi:MAG: RNA polymerase sigma factor [Cyclobacteriaceae bacterium]|nr:RNA polymerase sigma factor [Cyclobacteriaceae bacterium]MCH8516369.1 RNA polymerase sigma factor [Cyclobacteriaceae bacterium]
MKSNPTYSDISQLIAKIKAEEHEAFEHLYSKYSNALYNMSLSIVKDEGLAADVLQETMVKVWKGIDRFEQSKGGFFTWMLNICRNLSIDKIRGKHEKRSKKNTSIEDWIKTEKQGSQLSFDAIGLESLINQLPKEQSEPLRLNYMYGYTHAELASYYGVPLGTIKTRIRTGMSHLRKLLKT